MGGDCSKLQGAFSGPKSMHIKAIIGGVRSKEFFLEGFRASF